MRGNRGIYAALVFAGMLAIGFVRYCLLETYRARAREISEAERTLQRLSHEEVNLRVIADNLQAFKGDAALFPRRGGQVWPVRVDERLFARVTGDVPGAQVELGAKSGGAREVIVRSEGRPEQIVRIVGVLQQWLAFGSRARAGDGRLEVRALLPDSVAILSSINGRRAASAPAKRGEADLLAVLETDLEHLRSAIAAKRSSIAKSKAMVGELEHIAVTKAAFESRIGLYEHLRKNADRAFTPGELDAIIGAPSRFRTLSMTFTPSELKLAGELAAGVDAAALEKELGSWLEITRTGKASWTLRPRRGDSEADAEGE